MVRKGVQTENFVAVEKGKDADIEFLGHLLWYSVSNSVGVSGEDLKKELTDLGLEEYMPRKINPRNAFRRMTTWYAGTKNVPYQNGTTVNLLVREVADDAQKIVRQLVREVVDSSNVQLSYTPVVQIELDKNGNLTSFPMIAKKDLLREEKEIMDKLPGMLQKACTFYDGVPIRYMISVILGECGPVAVRPNGGVEFVPQKHVETVERLKDLSKRLSTYDGRVQMWSVPVIDASEHREMVQESLEEQVLGGTSALIHEMKGLVEGTYKHSPKITTKVAQGYAERIKKLKDLVGQYEESLEFQATKARENLELARLQAIKMMEAVETEE